MILQLLLMVMVVESHWGVTKVIISNGTTFDGRKSKAETKGLHCRHDCTGPHH